MKLTTKGYTVAPFGSGSANAQTPSDTPRGRGFTTGGGHQHPHTPRSQEALGSATPMTGLGFHGNGKGKAPSRAEGTVGRGIGNGGGSVIWGGGRAPLFVKASELFKDGEGDVITIDRGMCEVFARGMERA